MNQKQQGVVLAGLLAVALALSGCKGMRSSEDAGETGGSTLGSATSSSGQAGSKTDTSGNPRSSSGSSGSSGAMGSGTAGTTGVQTQEGAASMPNSTVLAIEQVPKSAGVTGAVGSGGAAGTTGSSGAGQAYRITLRMDDGSTQVVTQDTIPDFRSGDRVQVESGVIRR